MGKAQWWRRLHLDPVLVVCFAVLFGFPLAAAVVADGQPVDPEAAGPSPATAESGPPLRVLPAFSARSTLEPRLRSESLLTDARRMDSALARSLSELLGAPGGREALRLARRADAIHRVQDAGPSYPYRYAEVEPLLDSALRDQESEARRKLTNDAAALLVLAAAAEYGADEFPGAPALAFALLHRARARGDCLAQRNLAFLLSTDPAADIAYVRKEFRLAERACPGDLTAPWMLGQRESREGSPYDGELERRAVETFRRLQRQSPGSALGWSGEADALLRIGYGRDDEQQPFTARAQFRRALQLYRHAQRLDDDRGLAAGAARALAGLREYDAAVAAQRRAVAGRNTLAPLAVRYLEYLERDHRYAAAAGAARRLTRAHEFASPRSLIGGMQFGADDEDLGTPMSIGVDRMRPVLLDVGRGQGAVSPGVLDLSFIPQFRDVRGLTGHHRWCPSWALPRDLLLAGRPRSALAALPRRTVDLPTGFECDVDVSGVAAMAALEAGNKARALSRLALPEPTVVEVIAPLPTSRGRRLAGLYEAQQNLWRFAERSDRASAAAGAWLEDLPRDPRAADRLGEIAFLAKRYDDAARWFARSIRLSRARVRGWTAEEAFGLLKRGTALSLAGRRGEALAVLDRADEIATRADAAERGDDANLFASYHARVQAGDALLREGRYADAAEAYTAAREREAQLRDGGRDEELARPEALHNNQAIAESKLGHRAQAIAAADDALAADPRSPIFLETKGHALRVAGRLAQAERAYRAAVVSEPTAITAWNDLGVVLARQDRLDDAVRAFRRAVGVRDDYAIGWFNLGVAESRRGIGHALASQGAFGRAFQADEGLRDRRRRFIADDAVLFTNLDLSKPLPPRWSYARAQERGPVAAAGFALIVMLGLRVGRRLLASRFGGDLAGRLLDPLMQLSQRFPRVPIYTPWLVAAVATVAVFGFELVRPGAGGVIDAITLVVGVVALIVLVARGRRLAARAAGVHLGQRGWTPGIAIGGAAVALGSAWAPLPVVEPSKPAPAVHWIGPVLTAVAALGLLVLSAWLAVPSTLALAAAALVMTASLLTPTKPLDGGYVASGAAGVGIGFALLAGGLFFVLGVG